MSNKNIYLPYLMRIEKITDEAPGVKTFRLAFEDKAEGEAFDFRAGSLPNTRRSARANAHSALPRHPHGGATWSAHSAGPGA